jgi:serine/threonine protein kinase
MPTATPTPPTDQGDLLAGTAYRTLARLGQGGMGEVLEAEHRALRKRVVVKLLHVQLANDPHFADRMRIEAQALAALSSPHVVSVSDLGETPAGRPFLVMERLEGRTLREELDARGGALPVAEAIMLVRQVLSGLAAAHRIGIIHRDVKPDNVFLCAAPEGGRPLVKVLDFGVAKVVQRDGLPLSVPAPQYRTEEGALVGSPRTVSPEQARCQTVDARSDVYAVGLMLYTLIVGDGPFGYARDMLELLNAHIRDPPMPPSRVSRQPMPAELDRAILRALAKRPEYRFQTAAEFAEELRAIESVLAGTTQPLLTVAAPTSPSTAPSGVAPVCDAPVSAARASAPEIEAGTVIVRPAPHPAPARRSESSPPPCSGLGAEAEAWFARAAEDPPMLELPANLAPAPAAHPGEAREFVFLVVLSTTVFGLIAALIFRYLGYAGGH